MLKHLAAATSTLIVSAQMGLAAPDPGEVVDTHVLPSFMKLEAATADLAQVSETRCELDDPVLRQSFGAAFDAWIKASHLRLGPSESGDRAFALSFWPDSRGKIPKTLSGLIAVEDPSVGDPQSFAQVSIAGRGFYALEHLLYDSSVMEQGSATYRCDLVRAVTHDIHRNTAAILEEWQNGYADLFHQAGENDTYRSNDEALQALFGALTAGLQVTSDMRLGRPMGTFEKPRPRRAEARRSERSLRHVILSLEGTRDLAMALAEDAPEVQIALETVYDKAIKAADALNDPVFAGVETPAGRFRVETLQQRIDDIRAVVAQQLGPELGVAAGFNSLDGD